MPKIQRIDNAANLDLYLDTNTGDYYITIASFAKVLDCPVDSLLQFVSKKNWQFHTVLTERYGDPINLTLLTEDQMLSIIQAYKPMLFLGQLLLGIELDLL